MGRIGREKKARSLVIGIWRVQGHEKGIRNCVGHVVYGRLPAMHRHQNLSARLKMAFDTSKVSSKIGVHRPAESRDCTDVSSLIKIGTDVSLQSPRRICAAIHSRPLFRANIRSLIRSAKERTSSISRISYSTVCEKRVWLAAEVKYKAP